MSALFALFALSALSALFALFSFFVKVHLINVPPYIVGQEVAHVLPVTDTLPDKGRGDGYERSFDPYDRGMVVESAGRVARPWIEVDPVLP